MNFKRKLGKRIGQLKPGNRAAHNGDGNLLIAVNWLIGSVLEYFSKFGQLLWVVAFILYHLCNNWSIRLDADKQNEAIVLINWIISSYFPKPINSNSWYCETFYAR